MALSSLLNLLYCLSLSSDLYIFNAFSIIYGPVTERVTATPCLLHPITLHNEKECIHSKEIVLPFLLIPGLQFFSVSHLIKSQLKLEYQISHYIFKRKSCVIPAWLICLKNSYSGIEFYVLHCSRADGWSQMLYTGKWLERSRKL